MNTPVTNFIYKRDHEVPAFGAVRVPRLRERQTARCARRKPDRFLPRRRRDSKGFRAHKIATELDNARINVVGIETFGLLMVQLAIKGNKVAIAIAVPS